MKFSQTSIAVRNPTVKQQNDPHQVPIIAASSFRFRSIQHGMAVFDGEEAGHIYSRFGNPTIDAAAQKIADLEGYDLGKPVFGLFFSSGMSAIATAITSVLAGPGKVLAAPDLYGGTVNLLQEMSNQGVAYIPADTRDLEAVDRALAHHPDIRIVYVETPSNPTLRMADLAALAERAHAVGAKLIVDNTFATPVLQQPLLMGADVVIHSTTKFINGHGSGMGGALATADEALFRDRITPVYRLYGGNGNAFDAWLVLNGVRTLPIRMEKQSQNAKAVASWLKDHSKVNLVNYPGLPDSPGYAISQRQMKSGGAILSFELKGGTEVAYRFMNKLNMITLAPTLGDLDTIALHPATQSHRGLDPEVRLAQGIPDGLVRLSIGLESVEDILQDLDRAIELSGV
ncbi:MAG: aminotransferase class I/II-fold pyridoxal phosphate-dependent enzyme [Bacteroidota bacterium]